MATTTNYGWTTPDDTALVKDGASAIRTLGSSVDTTTKNLNPETTLGDLSFRSSTSNVNTRIPIGSSGQHLTVVAGVPAWATASDQTPLTTKGDLLGFSTLDARIPIGANGTLLTADSTESLGLKWAAPAGGGKVLQVVSATGANGVTTSSASNVDTGLTVSITPSSATSKVLVMAWHSGYVRNGNSSIAGVLGSSNLLRGSTSIEGTYFGVENYSSSNNKINYTNWTFMILDAPATTSATTYKTQYAIQTGTLNASNEGFIVAMEIGA